MILSRAGRVAAAAILASFSLAAQSDAVSNELRQNYATIKKNLTGMAEKMPAEEYSFKAAPTIRSFGELMAHVADSQARTCSAVNGEMKSINAAQKKTKDELVAAMKESFAICDTAFEGLKDADLGKMIKGPRGERSKAGTLAGLLAHSNEEYGYTAVYMRIKGVVPPSSEGR